MSRLRALIVDDEPIARQILLEELCELEGIEIVGEAGNGSQALEAIALLHPDVVFLDLHMPGLGGFDVVKKLDGVQPLPSIVIVTAFDQHAIQAFEAGALDYLLKPVSRERLLQCVERVQKLRRNPEAVAESLSRLQEADPKGPAARPRKIVGRLGEAYHLLDAAQVLAFQAEGEIVWIVTAARRYMATQTLTAIEERLAGQGFARIHRNTVINLEHVSKMAPLSSQRWQLTLSNGLDFTVSKRRARFVQELLVR